MAVQGTLLSIQNDRALDANGQPVANAKKYVYQAGTNNLQTIYTTQGMTIQSANPLSADGNGVFAEIWIPPGITVDIDITTSAGTGNSLPGYPRQNVPSVPTSSANADATWTAGEAIAINAACYLSDGSGGKTAGLAYNADSANDYSSTLPEVAIAIAAIALGSQGTVRKVGQLAGQAGLAAGSAYYVGTAGAITTVAPSLARRIGQAVSAAVLDISADPPTGGGGYDYVQLQVFG